MSDKTSDGPMLPEGGVFVPEGVEYIPFDGTMTIHQRMIAILAELPAIGKAQRNEQQNFMYRGHDDVLNALNPLLAKYGVFVVPNVLERVPDTRTTRSGSTMYEVNLRVEFTFYGAGGDYVEASAWGEGTDSGDKSTNKAMTMAFKNVLAQAFAISTSELSDADAGTPEPTTRSRGGSQTTEAKKFDPETDLLPDAPRGPEVGERLAEMQKAIDPSFDWKAFRIPILLERYGVEKLEQTTAAQSKDFFRRYCNALTKLTHLLDRGDMPPISDDEIREAFAWAFSGMVVLIPESESLAEARGASPGATESDSEPSGGAEPAPEAEKAAGSTPAHDALDEEAAAAAAADA